MSPTILIDGSLKVDAGPDLHNAVLLLAVCAVTLVTIAILQVLLLWKGGQILSATDDLKAAAAAAVQAMTDAANFIRINSSGVSSTDAETVASGLNSAASALESVVNPPPPPPAAPAAPTA